MQDLVKLLEKYESGISVTFVPTPKSEIARIEAAAGPLPGAYVRFLATMGTSTGDFQIGHGAADLRSRDIWEMPDQLPWLAGTPYLYIGQDNGPDGLDYFLDRSKPHGRDDCMVVQMPLEGGEMKCLVHAGLEEMLYYEAYAGVRLPLLPHRLGFRSSAADGASRGPTPESICAMAERLGFQRVPPATRCALYERGDAALLLYQNPELPAFRFTLAASDQAELDRLAQAFSNQAGVTAGAPERSS